MKTEAIIQSVRHHLHYLVDIIGPRPAGTPKEMEAFNYVQRELAAVGYDPKFLPVRFSGRQSYFFVFTIGAFFLMTGSLLVYRFPWIAIGLPVIIAGLPQFGRIIIQYFPRRAKTWNLAASKPSEEDKTELILCAHVDTARTNPFRNRLVVWANKNIYFYAQRCAFLLSAYSLTIILNLPSPVWLFYLIGSVSFLSGLAWLVLEMSRILSSREEYSPGAFDNGCSVAILLALANFFKEYSPEKTRLTFLFTGAEETGLYGAREYAAAMDEKKPAAVLNLDLIGCGEKLSIVTRDGTIFPRRTTGWMNRLLRLAEPSASDVWYTLKSGDYLPFLNKGIAATSIQTYNSLADRIYHTREDTTEVIEDYSLDLALRTVINFIELFEKNADLANR